MSIVVTRTIFCDLNLAPSCHHWYGETTDALADFLRAQAKRRGWRVGEPGGKDTCPECVAVQQTPPSGHRWTSHGHACCDAEIADRPPVVVTVCGGPRNCSKCRDDARAAHTGTGVSR